MDPTNGFTAINATLLKVLPLDKIEKRYFFESDLLFRLGCIRAVVWDVPMPAIYANEQSNLSVRKAALHFPVKHVVRFTKRLFYSYFLRGFNAGSVLLVAGITSLLFGVIYGTVHWLESALTSTLAPAGVVMLAALPVLLGIQCLLNFLGLDISNTPSRPIAPMLALLPDRSHSAEK